MRTITRTPTIAAVLLSATMLAGCATNRAQQWTYDDSVPPLPTVRRPSQTTRPGRCMCPPRGP